MSLNMGSECDHLPEAGDNYLGSECDHLPEAGNIYVGPHNWQNKPNILRHSLFSLSLSLSHDSLSLSLSLSLFPSLLPSLPLSLGIRGTPSVDYQVNIVPRLGS
jgi:hypothetical protein